MISGCGIVAKSSGSSDNDDSKASPIPVTAFANFTGCSKSATNMIRCYTNKKVDADFQDRVYEEIELEGPYKSVYTWLDNGTIEKNKYNWNYSTGSYDFVGTSIDDYEFNSYGLLKKRIFRNYDNSIKKVEIYKYTGYTGSGDVMLVDKQMIPYTDGIANTTINYQIIYERSIDGLSVTENSYVSGILNEKYCYTIEY